MTVILLKPVVEVGGDGVNNLKTFLQYGLKYDNTCMLDRRWRRFLDHRSHGRFSAKYSKTGPRNFRRSCTMPKLKTVCGAVDNCAIYSPLLAVPVCVYIYTMA